jgi:hypothetical protein
MSMAETVRSTYKSAATRRSEISEQSPYLAWVINAIVPDIAFACTISHVPGANQAIAGGFCVDDLFPSMIPLSGFYSHRNRDRVRIGGWLNRSSRRAELDSRTRKKPDAELFFQVIDHLPSDLLDEFVEAISGAFEAQDADKDIWGPAPSRDEILSAAMDRALYRYGLRVEAESDSIPIGFLAQNWDISEDDVQRMIRDRELVGLPSSGGTIVIPKWQLDDNDRAYKGLPEIIAAYPGGAAALSRWVKTPNRELDGSTPAELLAAGKHREILALRTLTTARQ